MRILSQLAAILVIPLVAQGAEPGDPLSASEFEALTTGRTYFYRSSDLPYGVEQYLPGRRVIWAFVGQECRRGEWYEEAGEICFVYEDESAPQCWSFWKDGSGLAAQFRGDPEGTPLVAVDNSPEPISCPGPDVGV